VLRTLYARTAPDCTGVSGFTAYPWKNNEFVMSFEVRRPNGDTLGIFGRRHLDTRCSRPDMGSPPVPVPSESRRWKEQRRRRAPSKMLLPAGRSAEPCDVIGSDY
jgi:hypothetical protein